MSDTESAALWTPWDHALVAFKIAVLEEAIYALKAQGPVKIVMMEIAGEDPEFFTVRFALSGEALERLDVPHAALMAAGKTS